MPAAKKILFVLFLATRLWGLTALELNQGITKQLIKDYPEYSKISINILIKSYQSEKIQSLTGNITYSCPALASEISVLIKGSSVLRIPVRVQAYAQVYYAKKNLEQGQIVSEDLFYQKETNVLRFSKKYAVPGTVFEGKILTLDLPADAPLYAWMLSRKPTVVPGETIFVNIQGDGVQLTLPAKVLQQGYIGDKVLVRLTSSQKVFKAEITPSGNCQIRL